MTNCLKHAFLAALCGACALAMAAPATAGPLNAANRDMLGLTTPLVTSVHYTARRHHHHRHHHHHHCPHHHHHHHGH
jgi:hypothetical protein